MDNIPVDIKDDTDVYNLDNILPILYDSINGVFIWEGFIYLVDDNLDPLDYKTYNICEGNGIISFNQV